MNEKEIQILTTVTIGYDGNEDDAVCKTLDSYCPSFDSPKDVSILDYTHEEIDLGVMNVKGIMMKGMNKFIFYSFNYGDYEDMIHYITRGSDFMFNHFKAKFDHLYNVYGCRAVMPSFYCELDTEFKRLMLEYIFEHYDGEKKI